MVSLRWSGLFLAILGGCHAAAFTEPQGRPSILFVGNSLTEVNDLPATVRAIAASTGDTLHIGSATGGGLALIDHINGATNAVQSIRDGHWTFVVLQQGPTTVAGICRDSFLLWTAMFDTIIRAAHGTPALFMVWPNGGSASGFDAVHASYLAAARSVGGVSTDPALPLYGSDQFHPSPTGSFLAALVIYEGLTGRDARTLPAVAFNGGQPMAMSVTTIQLLQNAAHQAVVGALRPSAVARHLPGWPPDSISPSSASSPSAASPTSSPSRPKASC